MHVLLDLFVHNRYMHLHNEYITDLFSQQAAEGHSYREEVHGVPVQGERLPDGGSGRNPRRDAQAFGYQATRRQWQS